MNYLPTEEWEGEPGRKEQKEEREAIHTPDEIFILFFKVMSQAGLMIRGDQIQELIVEEYVIHA